jgi:tetratricopeptide (TPR) repeat protein
VIIKDRWKRLLSAGRDPEYDRAIELYNQERFAEAAEGFDGFLASGRAGELNGQLARFYLGRALRNQGLMALHRGEMETAVTALDRACLVSPEQPDLRLQLGIARFNSGDYAGAAETLERVTGSGRDDLRVRIILGRAWLAAGRYDEAGGLFQALAGFHPRYPDLRHMLALAEVGRGRLTDAAEVLSQALQIRPTYLAARLDLSRVAWLLEDYDRSCGEADQVVETAPDFAAGWWCLALAQIGRGDMKSGRSAVGRLLALAGDHPGGSALMSLFQGELPGPSEDEAGRALDAAVEAHGAPADPRDWGRLIRSLQEAVKRDLLQARPWRPNFGEIVDLLEKEADEGLSRILRSILEERLAANPGFADLQFHLGRVHVRLGRLDDALACFQRAVAINPKYALAKEALEAVAARLGVRIEDQD